MTPDTVQNSDTLDSSGDTKTAAIDEGLRVENLGKSFKGRPVLRSVSFQTSTSWKRKELEAEGVGSGRSRARSSSSR